MKAMNEGKLENLRVFVSHAMADRESAQKLSNTMARRYGVRVFDPAEMLSAGEGWQTRLKEEITESDVFVALMSPAAMESANVLQEIGAAWALDKPVVMALKDVSKQSHLLESWSDQIMVSLDDLNDPEVMSDVLQRFSERANFSAEA